VPPSRWRRRWKTPPPKWPAALRLGSRNPRARRGTRAGRASRAAARRLDTTLVPFCRFPPPGVPSRPRVDGVQTATRPRSAVSEESTSGLRNRTRSPRRDTIAPPDWRSAPPQVARRPKGRAVAPPRRAAPLAALTKAVPATSWFPARLGSAAAHGPVQVRRMTAQPRSR